MSSKKRFQLRDGMIPLAALAAHMEGSRPLAEDPEVLAESRVEESAGAPLIDLVGSAAHVPWGPENWPQLVRDNVEVWPPYFKERELTEAVRRPLGGPLRIGIISSKVGVGKSAIAQLLRAIYAAHRDDGAVVLDANAQRAARPGLILDPVLPVRPGARARVGHAGKVVDGVVQRLGDGSGNTVAPPPGDAEYGDLMSLLSEHYGIVLCDVGSIGLEATGQILDHCDRIIVIGTPRLDGVYAATTCLGTMRAQGYGALADDAIVALNQVRPMQFSDLLNIDRHFRRLCRRVIRITWDERLAGGQLRSLDELRPSTRTGLYELAAAIAEGIGETATPRERRGVAHASV